MLVSISVGVHQAAAHYSFLLLSMMLLGVEESIACAPRIPAGEDISSAFRSFLFIQPTLFPYETTITFSADGYAAVG